MLAKLTSENQLALPKAIVADFQDSEYFAITTKNSRIVLTPVRMPCASS